MVVITEWFPDSPLFAGGGYYSFNNNQEDEGKEEEEEEKEVFQGASSEAKLKYPELKRKLNWTAGSRARLHNMGKTCASAQHIEYENIFCSSSSTNTQTVLFVLRIWKRKKEKKESEVHPPKPRNGAQKSENAEEWRAEQGPKDCAAAAHMSKFNLSFLCSKFYPILSYPLSHSRFIIFMFTFIVAIIQAGAAEADTTQQL